MHISHVEPDDAALVASLWVKAVAARDLEQITKPDDAEVVRREAGPLDEPRNAFGTYLFTQARADRRKCEPLPRRAHLLRIAVDPEQWGRGVGRSLLAHAVGAARARGYERLELAVRATNT